MYLARIFINTVRECAKMEECLRKLGFGNVKRNGRGGGGCISQGEVFSTDKGKIFVKKNTKKGADVMFEVCIMIYNKQHNFVFDINLFIKN